jgi:hypothetical protein
VGIGVVEPELPPPRPLAMAATIITKSTMQPIATSLRRQ